MRLRSQSSTVIILSFLFFFKYLVEKNYFKKLIHTIMGIGKLEIFNTSQLDTEARGDVAVLKLNTAWRQNYLLSWGPQSFLLRSSTDWMRLTQIMKGNLLSLKSTALNVNHNKKTNLHCTI